MLRNYSFQPSYSKTRNELYDDFYKPCMVNSIQYDRITGYFGSSIFLVINEALKKFIENDGHIRIICSPILSEGDINAIISGYKSKSETIITQNLNNIVDELSKEYPNSIKLLSNLISAGIIEIKLSVYSIRPDIERLVHDKAGIFIDSNNNCVGFRGSFNETFRGVSEYGNSESFDVFTNWEDEKDKIRIDLLRNQFGNMWNDTEPNIKTFEIPNITKDKIKSYSSDLELKKLIDESNEELYERKEPKWFAEKGVKSRIVRPHQEKILNNWEKNNRRGIFQMCTGSGKTFTALCAIRDAVNNKNEVPLILVPSDLLFKQWKNELDKLFNYSVSILLIGSGNRLNKKKLKIYTSNISKEARCILATYQSASKIDFINNINWGDHIFLICDEVHNIGARESLKLLEVSIGPRIGLSATPERYFSVETTKKIFSFFGGIVEPKYEISDAIRDKVLCEYFYYIEEVELTQAEQEKWNEITKDINRKYYINKDKENQDTSSTDLLYYERSDIVKKAEKKSLVAEKILLENFKEGQRWLVYLDDTDHVNKLKSLLDKHDRFKGNFFEYHTNTINDLPQTLSHFINFGAILLSINCLDEGIDIPSIDHAIILSSSKNPLQYIQRRGRVLRVSENKNFAYIYDCFVSPNSLEKDINKNKSIINGEVARAMLFSKDAKNSKIVENKIKIIMNNNNIDISEGVQSDYES